MLRAKSGAALGKVLAAFLITVPSAAVGYQLLADGLGSVAGTAENISYSVGLTVGLPVTGRFEGFSFEEFAGFWFPAPNTTNGVNDSAAGAPGAPAATRLDQNVPNPFNPETRLHFQIAAEADGAPARLEVYDVTGRSVAVLVDEPLTAGDYTITWDGRNTRGRSVASGVYFARLTTLNYSRTIRLVATK